MEAPRQTNQGETRSGPTLPAPARDADSASTFETSSAHQDTGAGPRDEPSPAPSTSMLCGLEKIRESLDPGTVECRYIGLLAELERMFPGIASPYSSRPAELSYLEAIKEALRQADALRSIRMIATQRLTARNHPCGDKDRDAREAVRQILAKVGVEGSVLR